MNKETTVLHYPMLAERSAETERARFILSRERERGRERDGGRERWAKQIWRKFEERDKF